MAGPWESRYLKPFARALSEVPRVDRSPPARDPVLSRVTRAAAAARPQPADGAQRRHRARRRAERGRRRGRAQARRGPHHPGWQGRVSRRRRRPAAAARGGHRHDPVPRFPARMSGEPGPVPVALPPASAIEADVARALAEDLGDGDVTALLLEDAPCRAEVVAKERAVLAGQAWFERCFTALD